MSLSQPQKHNLKRRKHNHKSDSIPKFSLCCIKSCFRRQLKFEKLLFLTRYDDVLNTIYFVNLASLTFIICHLVIKTSLVSEIAIYDIKTITQERVQRVENHPCVPSAAIFVFKIRLFSDKLVQILS